MPSITAHEVQQLVEADIAGRWTEQPGHAIDLRRCLVTPPRMVTCRNTFPTSVDPKPPTLQLWLILEETPGSTEGYVILFDESRGQFGLGCTGRHGGITFLGYYGSFWRTLKDM